MKILIYFLSGAFLLSACASSILVQDQEVQAPSDKFEADIGIVNHTDNYIYATMVEGAVGGHAHKMSAGVGNMCCVSLPRKWHDDIEVKVDWDVPEGTKHIYKTKVVKVDKYEGTGTLYLHFFPNDGVRVVVSRWIGASAKHPISPPPGTGLDQLQ